MLKKSAANIFMNRTITSADDILQHALEYNRKQDRPDEPSY
jgi:hypothetical protein